MIIQFITIPYNLEFLIILRHNTGKFRTLILYFVFQTTCTNHMYQSHVPITCTNHTYQSHVPITCTNHNSDARTVTSDSSDTGLSGNLIHPALCCDSPSLNCTCTILISYIQHQVLVYLTHVWGAHVVRQTRSHCKYNRIPPWHAWAVVC